MAAAAPAEDFAFDKDNIQDILDNDERLATEVDTFFNAFDEDSNELLDPDEFRNLIFGLCGFMGIPNPPKDVYTDMWKDTDADENGSVDKTELKSFMKKLLQIVTKLSDEDIMKMHEESKKFEEEELKKQKAAAKKEDRSGSESESEDAEEASASDEESD